MTANAATHVFSLPDFRVVGKDMDAVLFLSLLLLLSVGMMMVFSASIDYAAHRLGDPFLFAKKHFVYILAGLSLVVTAMAIPVRFWQAHSVLLLSIGVMLLILVLIPGIGRKVNGSQRWIAFGGLTLQVSELAKVFLVFYLSSYLVRKESELRNSFWGFVKPLLILLMVIFLLLLEPDYGAAMVVLLSALGVIFIAGVPLLRFSLLVAGSFSLAALAAVFEPYRLKRLSTFMDPWADDVKFDGGYQLTQSLIAFGRGEWFGVGLGNSVQKLFYLPEAHTDFVFSIWAEETGLLGVIFVIGVFFLLGFRIVSIGIRALQRNEKFMAYITAGFALIIGGQAFINIGVASGLLPTKGLTLPFISYGGSSLVVCCFMIGVILRIDWELKALYAQSGKKVPRSSAKSVGKKPVKKSSRSRSNV